MDEQQRRNPYPVTARCGRCARTSPKAPALAIIQPDAGQVGYVVRQPSTILVGHTERVPSSDFGGRTQATPVRTKVAHFECRSCGAKPRVKRGTLLRAGADAVAAGRDVIYV